MHRLKIAHRGVYMFIYIIYISWLRYTHMYIYSQGRHYLDTQYTQVLCEAYYHLFAFLQASTSRMEQGTSWRRRSAAATCVTHVLPRDEKPRSQKRIGCIGPFRLRGCTGLCASAHGWKRGDLGHASGTGVGSGVRVKYSRFDGWTGLRIIDRLTPLDKHAPNLSKLVQYYP